MNELLDYLAAWTAHTEGRTDISEATKRTYIGHATRFTHWVLAERQARSEGNPQ